MPKSEICHEKKECFDNWGAKDSFLGVNYRTWDSRDPYRKTVETGRYVKINGTIVFEGSKSGENYLRVDGDRFITEKMPWVSGKMFADGKIVWSHGYR